MDLLKILYEPYDLVEFRFIETWTEDTKKKSQIITTKFKSASSWIKTSGVYHIAKENKANIFFGVCPRASMSGQEKDIRIVRCLWADIDYTTPQEALKRVKEAQLPHPTVSVNSGNGSHLYWKLSEPVLLNPDEGLCETGLHIKQIVYGIAKALGGDSTHDLARILRLDNSMNRKDERNGKEPVPCSIFETIDATYNIENFENFKRDLPMTTTNKKQRCNDFKTLDDDGKRYEQLTAKQKELLNKLINDSANAQIGKRSERDFCLCIWACKLKLAPSELWERVQAIGRFEDNGYGYFQTTILNARNTLTREQQIRDAEFTSYLDSQGSYI